MKKLLLADDSITIQKVVRLSFAGEDIEVSTADNGDAAIEALERNPPDIVLADIYMPGRSGFAVCEHVKSNAHLSHIPVILLVGIFEPFDQEEAGRAHHNGVLTKPFETMQLIQMVQELLQSSAAKPPSELQMVQCGGPSDVAPEPRTGLPQTEVFAAEGGVESARSDTGGSELSWDRVAALAPGLIEEDTILDIFDDEEMGVLVPAAQLESAPPEVWIQLAGDAAVAPAGELAGEPAPISVPRPVAVPDRVEAAQLSDSQIEHIVQRVIQRLSDQVVRELAWEVVPEMAERVIRDEIRKRAELS